MPEEPSHCKEVLKLAQRKRRLQDPCSPPSGSSGVEPASFYLPKKRFSKPVKPAPWRASSFAISKTVSAIAS